MRKDIEIYLNDGRRRGVLCEKYDEMLAGPHTAREYFDAALSVQGMGFVCASVRDGWFLPPSAMFQMFGRMINGQYTHEGPGYTSKMYYRFKGGVLADTTAVCIIESNIGVKVHHGRRLRIYAAGRNTIRLIGDGRALVVCFGDESSVSIKAEGVSVEKKFIPDGFAE